MQSAYDCGAKKLPLYGLIFVHRDTIYIVISDVCGDQPRLISPPWQGGMG